MTLIASYMDRNVVIQVSDRRLTTSGRPPADEKNKAVVVCDRCTFALTGLAKLGGADDPTAEMTDEWMARTIRRVEPRIMPDACFAVRDAATDIFPRLPLRSIDKKVGFVCIGWHLVRLDLPFEPTLVLITNSLTMQNEWLGPEPQFRLSRETLPRDKDFEVRFFGVPLHEDIQAAARRSIAMTRRRLRRRLEDRMYDTITRILVQVVDAVASENPAVGHGMNVVSLSRPPRPTNKPDQQMMYSGFPTREGLHIASIPFGAEQVWPIIVCEGKLFSSFRTIREGANIRIVPSPNYPVGLAPVPVGGIGK